MKVFITTFLLFFALTTEQAQAADKAPDFTLPTDGGEIALSALRGKVVYLDFWASWCGPCRKSFPWMNEMHAKFKDQDLVIIGINLDADKAPIKKFLDKTPANFVIAYDPEGAVAQSYGLVGMPVSYLIDRDGNIIDTHIGFRQSEIDKMQKKIEQALKQ